MTNSKKNPRKELRSWEDLEGEKKGYLKRKQEDEEAKKELRKSFAEDFPNTWGDNGPPF